MDLTRFEKFREGLAACLPGAVSQILGKEKGSDFCEIGFITTDDLYGCFITWDTSGCIDEYFDWDQQLEPETDFLYQPLVEVDDGFLDSHYSYYAYYGPLVRGMERIWESPYPIKEGPG